MNNFDNAVKERPFEYIKSGLSGLDGRFAPGCWQYTSCLGCVVANRAFLDLRGAGPTKGLVCLRSLSNALPRAAILLGTRRQRRVLSKQLTADVPASVSSRVFHPVSFCFNLCGSAGSPTSIASFSLLPSDAVSELLQPATATSLSQWKLWKAMRIFVWNRWTLFVVWRNIFGLVGTSFGLRFLPPPRTAR